MEDLDVEASRKCGVTKDSLRAPAVLILRQNRIDVASRSTAPYLYINLNILSSGASCVYHLDVSIKTSQTPKDRNGFRANEYEGIVLCSSDGVGIVPASGAPKTITEEIELNLKRCLAKVSY